MADRATGPLRAQPAPDPGGRDRQGRGQHQRVRLPPTDRGRCGGGDHRRPRAPAGRQAPRPWRGAGERRGDLSPAQAKAYRLADNRIAEESSWDYELLPLEIAELADLDYEIDVLGFDPDEVAGLLATPTARPHRPRRGPRAARASRSRSPATSGCSASTACSAATPPRPPTSSRLHGRTSAPR